MKMLSNGQKSNLTRYTLIFILAFLVTNNVIGQVNVTEGTKERKELPNIVVVTTGGTIAEKIDPKSGAAEPAVSGDDLIKAIPALNKIAKIKVVSVCNIDSSHMTPAIWSKLSIEVDKILADEKIKGVVVTHGTDTMAEGSFFLELTLKSRKPVVFTGAMRNASQPGPDGPANLYNATLQVVSAASKEWGVTVSLNNYINSAWSVRKASSFNPQTFESGMKGYLHGKIFIGTHFRDEAILSCEKSSAENI